MFSTPAPLPLAKLPTPLEPLRRLSAHLGIEVWIKRDDLTGFGLSGNKVRKLDFLLADAVQQEADTVITTGGMQSNHCRATAVACRRLGLSPALLLRGELPETADGNLLLGQMLGADVHTCTPETYRHHRQARLSSIAESYRRQGRRPYIIDEGGSSGRGALGFVRAGRELAHQSTLPFDGIIVPVGSGGTMAGLACAELNTQIVGIPVCDDSHYFASRISVIANEAQALGAPPLPHQGAAWTLLDGYQGDGYGIASPDVWSCIDTVARLEGIFLDPVYTGKAMWALFSEARAGRLSGRWLFWHTGGTFGMFGRGGERART